MTPARRVRSTALNKVLRTARSIRASGGRAARETSGAAAVEFALVVWPFLILVFAALQTAMIFVLSQAVQTVAVQTGREYMTGQTAGLNQAAFKAAACSRLPAFFNCANLMVDVQTASAASALNTAALTPTYTYNMVTHQYTLNNSGWAYTGSVPGTYVILRVMYDWPVLGGKFAFANQPNGTLLMVGTSVFRVEPYPT